MPLTKPAANTADVGLVGLAVMGQNLVLNMADHGFKVAVYNRTAARADIWVAQHSGASAPTPREAARGRQLGGHRVHTAALISGRIQVYAQQSQSGFGVRLGAGAFLNQPIVEIAVAAGAGLRGTHPLLL